MTEPTTEPISDSLSTPLTTVSKRPVVVFDRVLAFSPNRDTLGGTAYLLLEATGNILIDCPDWNEVTQSVLQERGGVRWLFLTHRGGMGKVKEIQQFCNCEVLIQEQEAYLLPGLQLTTFQSTFALSPTSEAIWTCGHSPGSACLYYRGQGGILFSGRHLLPTPQATPAPLRLSKTFHWPRQIRSVQLLRDRFTPETLNFICPGANTGFLRGQRVIPQAYEQLAQLDLEACLLAKSLL